MKRTAVLVTSLTASISITAALSLFVLKKGRYQAGADLHRSEVGPDSKAQPDGSQRVSGVSEIEDYSHLIYRNVFVIDKQHAGFRLPEGAGLPVPEPRLAPKDAHFVKSGDSLTYSLNYTRRAVIKNGKALVTFPDRVDSIRESPDQRLLVSYGPPHGWQIHAIMENECIEIDHELPSDEDLQLYWIGNRTLVGVSVIYEEEMRPLMEDCFAEDTRLFICNVDTAKSTDLDMSAFERDPDTFFRIDGVSPNGFIKLSLVNSEQYFLDGMIRDLETFQIL
jgi:hypothetical protein